jgi:CheY-like chemotaxis protein
VTVEVRCETGGHAQGARTGAGIAPVLMAHLFEPFTQGTQTLDRTAGGPAWGGHGQGPVELHEGASAHSDGRKGAVLFSITLPITEAPSPAARDRGSASPRGGGCSYRGQPDAAESIRECSASGGTMSRWRSTGAGAGAGPASQRSLVLCDLGLPGMDGYEVARAFAERASWGLPVALSG